MCAITAVVGVLVEIAFHVQHHDGCCALYIGERGARARALGCHFSCFRSLFASQFGDDSRLCWRSALSGLVSDLVSGLCSPFCRRSAPFSAGAQFSSLFRFCLISASATPLARHVAFHSTVSLVKTTVFSEKLSQKKLSAILLNSIQESSFPNLFSNDVVIPFPLFPLEKVYLASFITCQNHFLI